MRGNLRIPIAAVAAILAIGLAASVGQTAENGGDNLSPKPIQWSLLAPENGKPFIDPFAMLSSDQLADLSYVVRVRRLIADEKIEADGEDAKTAAELARKLDNEGIDIDWLMVQRQRVRQMRGLQIEGLSKTIAESLRDKEVTLTGYAVPIKVSEGRMKEFFLVPTIAACSHEAAPPRLQVIFVSTDQGVSRPDKGIPVRVTGRVKAQTTIKTSINGNGKTTVRSAYAMLSPEIDVYDQQKRATVLHKR
jgi:hypothetical protein